VFQMLAVSAGRNKDATAGVASVAPALVLGSIRNSVCSTSKRVACVLPRASLCITSVS